MQVISSKELVDAALPAAPQVSGLGGGKIGWLSGVLRARSLFASRLGVD